MLKPDKHVTHIGVLHNWRWELFARGLVEAKIAGLDKKQFAKARTKAYTEAGFAPNADNARRDANNAAIKARVDELFAEALEFRDVRAATVVTRIDRIGRANLADFFERAEGGGYQLKDITTLPRELTEALAAIEWDDEGRPKIKLHDKNQANFTLLKHLGGLPDESERRPVNLNFFAGLSVDDQRALAEALEALPAGPAIVDSQTAGERGGA